MNVVQLGGKTAGGGGSTVPKTAYFDGDGATLVFNVDDGNDISIQSVFVGGQRYKEGTDYTKDNDAKTVTLLGAAPPVGVGIDVEYFSDVSITRASVSNLTPEQLQQLAEDLAPYII